MAAGLTGPIFTFGAIEGQVASAEAAQRAALSAYQQVILNAFRETNDALVGTQNRREQAALQANRVVALREFARLSNRGASTPASPATSTCSSPRTSCSLPSSRS